MDGPVIRGGPIAGVIAEPRAVITDAKGAVLHHLRVDSPRFERFGEVYCSTVYCGAVKAWKRHHRITQHLIVPCGRVLFVIYDDRSDSGSRRAFMEVELGRECHGLLVIPPMLWYGFTGLGPGESLIVNCTDAVHDPAEADRRDVLDPGIPYAWDSGAPPATAAAAVT